MLWTILLFRSSSNLDLLQRRKRTTQATPGKEDGRWLDDAHLERKLVFKITVEILARSLDRNYCQKGVLPQSAVMLHSDWLTCHHQWEYRLCCWRHCGTQRVMHWRNRLIWLWYCGKQQIDRQWLCEVCTLIDNDIRHQSGQNLLRTQSAAPRESTTFLTTVMKNIAGDKSNTPR